MLSNTHLVADSEGIGEHCNNLVQFPPELYVEIFLAASRSKGNILRDNPHWKKPHPTTPFTLGAVCRLWRDIVRSTPLIWSEINLQLHPTRLDDHFSYLDHFLTHSGTCPLTITMAFEKEDTTGWQPALSYNYLEQSPIFPLIKLLLSSAPRWRCVDMTIPEKWYPDFEKSHLPNLISMRIRPLCSDSSNPTMKRRGFNMLHNSFTIQNLHISDLWSPYADIPWRRLRRLTLKDKYTDECLYVLSEAQNLVWCRLTGLAFLDWPRRTSPPGVERPVALRSLRKLILEDFDGDYPTPASGGQYLLDNLSCPVLESLQISTKHTPKAVLALLSNRFTSLTRLGIHDFFIEEETLLNCLRDINFLEELDIGVHRSRHISSGLLKAIFITPHSPKSLNYTLPNLKRFSISGPMVLKNSNLDCLLLKVFRFRNPVHEQVEPKTRRLDSFGLETAGRFVPSPLVKRELMLFVEGGLKLEVVCGGLSWI